MLFLSSEKIENMKKTLHGTIKNMKSSVEELLGFINSDFETNVDGILLNKIQSFFLRKKTKS